MVDANGIRVRDLLPEQIRLDQTLQNGLMQKNNAGIPKLPPLAWRVATTEADAAIRGVLDTDVFSLLARGWCLARELKQYSDPGKYPPDQTSIVYLGKHTLTTQVHPVLVVTIGAIECRPLRFTLEMNAEFRTAALLIQAGHITGLAAGDCSATAQLKYADINLHNPLESRQLVLPGKIQFAPPGLALG